MWSCRSLMKLYWRNLVIVSVAVGSVCAKAYDFGRQRSLAVLQLGALLEGWRNVLVTMLPAMGAMVAIRDAK